MGNTIKIIDGIYCKAGSELKKKIAPCLQYEYVHWKQGPYAMSKQRKTRYFIDQRSGRFLMGLLPRVEKYCQVSNIPYSIEGETEKLIHTEKPNVKGMTLRKDQIDLCHLAAKKQRGVIKSPTGSGKTVIIMGIIGMYPGKRVLVLSHTKDIILQTYDEFKEKGLKDLQVIMGGKSKDLKGQIILSTIQSFSKISTSKWIDKFDIVIVDECFASGTNIRTDKDKKEIQNIKVGDKVYTKNGIKEVTFTFKNKVPLSNVIKVRLSNGNDIICSRNHLYYIDSNWLEAYKCIGKKTSTFDDCFSMVSGTTLEVRVESVEVYKRGSNDSDFESIIGDKERNQGFVEFYDLEVKDDHCYFAEDILVHNCHHCISIKSLYGKFAIVNLSPIKIGMTATVPKKKEEQLVLEGLIGPIIGELSIEEGIDMKILAKPKITLISVPVRPGIMDQRSWSDIYKYSIVENRLRNTAIVKAVVERIKKKQTVLVMVKEIEHGNILVGLGKKMKVRFKFVQGSTDNRTRMETKNALNDKKERAVISTAIWREGINIPTLDCVINAIGGKSEIQTLQNIGRGLRITDDKKEVEIIDFLDPYRYVAEHSIRRLQVYVDNGWL